MTELDFPAQICASAVRPRPAGGWLQYNLEHCRATPDLYAALVEMGEGLLADGVVADFFFVHKAPGLRLRFRVADGASDVAACRIERLFAGLFARDLAIGLRPAVYEPEQRLFGGPVSMRSVHRVFTADSLAWLAFHAADSAAGSALTTWAFSLLTIRGLMDALEIVGWEDIDVWDRLSRDGGRELTAVAVRDPRVERVVAVLRAGWADPRSLRDRLPATMGSVVDRYRAVVEAEAPGWIADYFTSPGAEVGPRQAVAFTVIFHWNRGRLPLHHQALITHALGCRPPAVRA